MMNFATDQNDWEERRRLSFALAMRADTSSTRAGVYRLLKQAFHELGTVVMPQPHEKIIGLSLMVLALLATADVWVAQMAARSAPPPYITSRAPNPETVRVAPVHPALSASMISAASPF